MASWESGMKVDPVSYCSFGVYSEVYGAGEEGNIANLFGSLGMVEEASVGVVIMRSMRVWFWEFIK